jgi:hypothetical protein
MATNKSQVKCYKPSNCCVWVSMSLSHSKTDQNSRKNQVSDLHQWSNLRLPSISRHNSNEPRLSHQGTSCFLAEVCTTGINCTCLLHVFFSFFFFWLHDGSVCSTDSFTCCKGRMSPEVRSAAMLVQSEVRHAG